MAAPVSVPTTFLTAKYDELIAVKFWSDFDATLDGKGRKYKAGNVAFLPAIVVAAMMHNGEKVLWEKKAWLTLDGIALATGVGQARIALRAGSWLNELRLLASTADIAGSAMNMVVSLTNDQYISQEVKDDIGITCMLLQAPEAAWSFAEVFQHFRKTKREVEQALNDSRIANKADLNKLNNILETRVGNLDDALDAAQTAKMTVGLTKAEQEIVEIGLSRITDNSKVYIALHGEGNTFIIYHNGVRKEFNHRSLARYIQGNPNLNNKDIVLLSCGNTQTARNLANKLNRKVIGWDGKVEVFENGYIKGYGTCREHLPGARLGDPLPTPMSDNLTPKGTNELPIASGINLTKKVVLEVTDWDILETKLRTRLTGLMRSTLNYQRILDDMLANMRKAAQGTKLAQKLEGGVFETAEGYLELIKKASIDEQSVNAALQTLEEAEILCNTGVPKSKLRFEHDKQNGIHDVDLGIKTDRIDEYEVAYQFKYLDGEGKLTPAKIQKAAKQLQTVVANKKVIAFEFPPSVTETQLESMLAEPRVIWSLKVQANLMPGVSGFGIKEYHFTFTKDATKIKITKQATEL